MLRRQAGFSLVEVLVAVLVLALGVLGAARLQLTALRTGQQSGLHSAAVQLAAEMADRIRANDASMRAADADNPFLGADYDAANGTPLAPALCYASGCDSEALARFDLYEWQRRLQAALPGARAAICRDGEPWNAAARAFQWECDDEPDAPLVIKVGWHARDPDGSRVLDANGEAPPAVALVVSPYVE